MKWPTVLPTLFILAWLGSAGAGEPLSFDRPNADQGPTEVEVLVFILDLDQIDAQAQSFDASVMLAARWTDPRERHEGLGTIVKNLDDVWHPRLQMLNLQRRWTSFREIVEIEPDGQILYRQRFWGSFSQPLRLREFPADHQSLVVQVVAPASEDEIRFVASTMPPCGIAKELSITDWDVVGFEPRVEPVSFVPEFRPTAALQLVVEVKRRTGFFIVKIILPLILIVAMSWIVFWIDPKEGGTQISVAVTSMLTLIAYRFAVGARLPDISYLTRLDYFILASTILVFSSLVEVVIVSRMARRKSLIPRARTIDRWCRYLFPAAFVVLTLETLMVRAVF